MWNLGTTQEGFPTRDSTAKLAGGAARPAALPALSHANPTSHMPHDGRVARSQAPRDGPTSTRSKRAACFELRVTGRGGRGRATASRVLRPRWPMFRQHTRVRVRSLEQDHAGLLPPPTSSPLALWVRTPDPAAPAEAARGRRSRRRAASRSATATQIALTQPADQLPPCPPSHFQSTCHMPRAAQTARPGALTPTPAARRSQRELPALFHAVERRRGRQRRLLPAEARAAAQLVVHQRQQFLWGRRARGS